MPLVYTHLRELAANRLKRGGGTVVITLDEIHGKVGRPLGAASVAQSRDPRVVEAP